MSKVLVTGGAGFIGSHVVHVLVDAGHEVLVVDDLSRGKGEHVPAGVRLIPRSVNHPEMFELMRHERPEIICHLAAQVSVRDSVANPHADAAANIMGLLRLMESARKAGSVRQVIFASTGGAIYGDEAPVPAPESTPPLPISPYGCSKAAAEMYLSYYQAASDIRAVSLRYANVYGPRQDPHGEAGVVAIFARKLLDGVPCRINGSGTQTRDFVFVEDVARANLLAIEREAVGRFNIGTGIETDINELYARMAALVPDSPEAERGPALPGEQMRSAIDATLAASSLGWRPSVSLEDGLRTTLESFR